MTEKTPKTVKHGIVNRVQGSMFAYQGWPSIARDENGTLYAVASSFRCEHVCPFGKTAMYISKNDGETWSPPIIINDTYLDDRDAGILYMGNGRMLVTWFTHPADVYLNHYYTGIRNSATPMETPLTVGMLSAFERLSEEDARGGSYVRVSEDYGMTWSEKIWTPISAPHGPSLCRDGTLLYLGKEHYLPDKMGVPGNTADALLISAYASTDGGYTWEKRGDLTKPAELHWDNFHEPHVIELDDGTLYGMIRAQGNGVAHGFTMYSTKSKDGGRTWTEWESLGISGSPPHLLRHSSGALICVYGRREAPFGERAVVSWDNGETWTEDYDLDHRAEGGDLGYPASVELDDGSILTVYYQKYYDETTGKYDGKCSILYTRWTLDAD
ncbi:MAG: exo-alpha-sialidase [Clostridia bacterium]|nr:exo-alpha-sialidase [Clostridia bacterium]